MLFVINASSAVSSYDDTALVLTALALVLTRATTLETRNPLLLLIVAIMLSTRFGGWNPLAK